MKNKWLKFKKWFHKYMCNLEDSSYFSPIFLLYLIFELIRVSMLIMVVYFFYKLINEYILCVLR